MIKVRENILDKEDYQMLPPQLKEKYVHNIIKETIKSNFNGITMTEILENLPFSRKAIEKHIEKLLATNVIYARNFGKTNVFFPNGRAIRADKDEEIKLDNKKIRVVLLDTLNGKRIYIQEISKDKFSEEIQAGILIPIDSFEEFVDMLTKYKKSIKGLLNENS